MSNLHPNADPLKPQEFLNRFAKTTECEVAAALCLRNPHTAAHVLRSVIQSLNSSRQAADAVQQQLNEHLLPIKEVLEDKTKDEHLWLVLPLLAKGVVTEIKNLRETVKSLLAIVEAEKV